MAGNKYALEHVLDILAKGPLPLSELKDRLNAIMGYMEPTTMELVGLLKKKNGIEKNEDNKYQLIPDSD